MIQKLQTITSLLKHIQHLLLSFSPLKQVICYYDRAYDFIRPHFFNINYLLIRPRKTIITFILLFYHSRSTIVVSLKNSLNLKSPYIILLLLIVSHLISINVWYTTKACLVGLQNFFLQVSYYGIELILSLDLGEIFTLVPQEMSKLYIFLIPLIIH
jgi:hypothetical protein